MALSVKVSGFSVGWSVALALASTATAQTRPAPTATAMPAKGEILTPPAPQTPRINGASVFGVRPKSPILYQVPVTGRRPITYSATGLPAGVTLDARTGRLGGTLATPGEHRITLRAANALGTAERSFRLVVGDTIALTPPLGWNSYNVWGDQVTQARTLAAARAMVASGLVDHGWTYINIDDGWQGTRSAAATRALQPDPTRFTDMKAMTDQIHAMGLKVGIYHSPWVRTYANRPGGSSEDPRGAEQVWDGTLPKNVRALPFHIGRYTFTEIDAKQFADWGIDYVKYDWGPVEYPEAKRMDFALRKQPRDIVLSLSNNHEKNMFVDIARISTVASAWRTTTDIYDGWKSVGDDIGFAQDAWAPFAKPGHYNDADMLVVGWVGWGQENQHPTKLTPDEQYSHISLWSLLASPLLLGADLEKLDPFTLNLLTNDEVLGINQDVLANQAVQVMNAGGATVYRKQLEDGSIAVGLFNRSDAPMTIAARWTDLKLTGAHDVRDLWRQKDLGSFTDLFTTPVAPHGVRLVRIAPSLR